MIINFRKTMDQILRDKTKLSIACSKSYAGNNIQFKLLIRLINVMVKVDYYSINFICEN